MKRKVEFENNEIIKGIANGDERVISYLYENYFNDILLFIRNNSGSRDDAEDVFQDALLLVYQKTVHDKVILYDGFQAYFFVVCKFIWTKKLNRKITYNRILNEIDSREISFESLESSIEVVEKKKLFLDHIELLSERCKKLIMLFESGKSHEEIAKILNIDSIKYTKKMKYKCKERLIKSIKSDLRFIELTNDN